MNLIVQVAKEKLSGMMQKMSAKEDGFDGGMQRHIGEEMNSFLYGLALGLGIMGAIIIFVMIGSAEYKQKLEDDFEKEEEAKK